MPPPQRAALDDVRFRWEHGDLAARYLGSQPMQPKVHIHHFVDGNGRVATLVADLAYFAAQETGDVLPYDWPFDRDAYIRLLREYGRTLDPSALSRATRLFVGRAGMKSMTAGSAFCIRGGFETCAIWCRWLCERGRSWPSGSCLTLFTTIVRLMTMSTMPLAEVKAHLSEVVSRVNGQHERVTVTVHGQPSAVIMAPDDVERLEEMIAVLADGPLILQLTESEADLAQGRAEGVDSLARAMRARAAGA